MGKRLYLCNLIPLWKLDDEKLDVDWDSAEVRKGDLVELRVLVKDLPLNVDPPDFRVRYEIKESDFLLSGGFDDEAATIEGPAQRSDGAEGRPFKVVTMDQLPSGAERLEHIFLTPSTDEEGENRLLIRCFWRAEQQDDVSGNPEYYFDFALNGPGGEREERSDRELGVQSDAGGFGKGLGLRPGELARAAELGVAPAPIIIAAGWSTKRAALGEEVELLALVEGALPGHPLTFEILDNPTPESEVLERIDTVIEENGIQSVRWTPPRPFPIPEITHLAFRSYVEYVPERIAYSTDVSKTVGDATQRFHGSLELEADLEIEIVDAAGAPQGGVPYSIEKTDGEVVAKGVSDAVGKISIPPSAGTDHHVRLERAWLTHAAEPGLPDPAPPENGAMVFSVVQLLPPPSKESAAASSNGGPPGSDRADE